MNHGTLHTSKNLKAAYDLKRPETDKFMRTEAKCLICENTVFNVEDFSAEQIMLTCENCGEPHLINIKITCENKAVLAFECPE